MEYTIKFKTPGLIYDPCVYAIGAGVFFGAPSATLNIFASMTFKDLVFKVVLGAGIYD